MFLRLQKTGGISARAPWSEPVWSLRHWAPEKCLVIHSIWKELTDRFVWFQEKICCNSMYSSSRMLMNAAGLHTFPTRSKRKNEKMKKGLRPWGPLGMLAQDAEFMKPFDIYQLKEHKAVAEVSKIGRRVWLLWCMDGRANPLMDGKVAGASAYLSVYLSDCVTS